MSRILTHPEQVDRILAGRRGIPDAELDAILDGYAVPYTNSQGDGHACIWSIDGNECLLCGHGSDAEFDAEERMQAAIQDDPEMEMQAREWAEERSR